MRLVFVTACALVVVGLPLHASSLASASDGVQRIDNTLHPKSARPNYIIDVAGKEVRLVGSGFYPAVADDDSNGRLLRPVEPRR